MTVRSYLREPRRPVVFVPVYFGYERIVEGRTYIGELSGAPKEKESVLGLLRSLRGAAQQVRQGARQPRRAHRARRAAGRAQPALARRRAPRTRRPAAPAGSARRSIELAVRIMRRDQRGRRRDADQSGRHGDAGDAAPGACSRRTCIAPARALPEAAARGAVRAAGHGHAGERRADDPLRRVDAACSSGSRIRSGDIMRMSDESAVLATYYRNNILHLFAMPSLIACCFIGNARMRTEDIQRLVWRVYPYIRAELFLRWPEAGDRRGDRRAARCLRALESAASERGPHASGAAPHRPRSRRCSCRCSRRPRSRPIERYYLVIALLHAGGQRAHRPRGARAALPPDGAAHVAAVRPEFARSSSTRACSAISSTCCAAAA